MTAPRVTGILAWHPEVPGSDRHVGRIRASRPGSSPVPDLSLAGPELDWQDRALCAETDAAIFHPERGGHDDAASALRVCAACEVRARCLEWALENGERHGVWGGTTARARRKMIAGRERNGLAA